MIASSSSSSDTFSASHGCVDTITGQSANADHDVAERFPNQVLKSINSRKGYVA